MFSKFWRRPSAPHVPGKLEHKIPSRRDMHRIESIEKNARAMHTVVSNWGTLRHIMLPPHK